MITSEQIGRQSSHERHAWLDSLNDDESAIAHTPIGHRYTIVIISEIKRRLLQPLSAAHRLRFLEFLDSHTDLVLTAEAIAAVEPMSDEALEMVEEARKLGAAKARRLRALGSVQRFRRAQSIDPDRNQNFSRPM